MSIDSSRNNLNFIVLKLFHNTIVQLSGIVIGIYENDKKKQHYL